ncbi:MarR family winged helix-turn-helix transcriptional regulator [uncultured Ruegeria sp.]|uniref:MarR family winged helix-turn-helix transcriptional regulator n=1 Tax=uncultured Ruegeria sp. TaxID=259304 RepID=UPI0026182CBC|nr:MarR family winged helix-turn-helix transcriptional regulator [uncultured Ruegeria sp.]
MIDLHPSKFFAAQALHQLLPMLDRMMRQIEQRAGATGQQLSAIAAISEFGMDRLHLLASHEGVSRPTMSRLVNNLEARGWILKQIDKGDLRTPRLSVTDIGRKMLVASCEERTQILMNLMGEFDEKECAAFSSILRKLHANPRPRMDRPVR